MEKIYHLGIKGLIQNLSGNILLLKVDQEKFKNPKPGSYWDIPGGRVTKGQSIEETLKREIKEETGLTTIESIQPLETLISNIEIPLEDGTTAGLVLSIYRCVVSSDPTITLSEEHTDFSWASPKEASELLAYKFPKEFTEKLKALI